MKNILIMGGNYNNKGAEAMSLHVLQEIKRRYSGAKVTMLINNGGLNKNLPDCFDCENELLSIRDYYACSGGWRRILARLAGEKSSRIHKLEKILNDADVCIDVSGYRYASNFSHPFVGSIKFILELRFLKKHNVKVVVMPQSFGPFEYKIGFKHYLHMLAKRYFGYPKIIYAREKKSYEYMKEYYLASNLKKSLDMVLLGGELCPKYVYKTGVNKEYAVEMEENSVAIIPNVRIEQHSNSNYAFELYVSIIKSLLKQGKKVYILRHCNDDYELCKRIKDAFVTNQVELIDEELDCIQFSKILRNFDFIVASRYHAIVHAFKIGVPCVAVGWADKYIELLSALEQEKYILDLGSITNEKLKGVLINMIKEYQKEAEVIKCAYEKLKNNTLYDEVFEALEK